MREDGYCCSYFVILQKTPPFYEVKEIRRKWLPHWKISKK
jgi:hypothetical protein